MGRFGRHVQLTESQRISHARNALTKRKRAEVSASDVVSASVVGNGVYYPSDSREEKWRIHFYRVKQMMRAQLYALGTSEPLIALDHHAGRAQDMFGETLPPGYHWDVYWPFKTVSALKARIRIDNDFHDSYAVVVFVANMWNLELQPDLQGSLPL